MGHLYVKENETFSTSRNGTVPKPTAADVSANKILQADGTWVNNSGGGGGALDDLTDVSISSPVAGHTLVYNEDDNEWQNTFLEEKMCLANVSGDVFIDNPAQGEVLTYNGSTWINAEPPSGGVDELTELTDVDIDTPLDGHVLAYDALSDKWKNAQPSGGADSLNDLTDVGITSAADGQILKYNSTTHKWENTNESGGTVTDVKVNGTSVVSSGEALIKSYKELTQAQYDALPSSKLTDGVLYCITDDGVVDGSKYAPTIYSYSERQIGVWVNGMPLYQKTINFGALPNNTTKSVAHNIDNLASVAQVYGISWNDSGSYVPIPFINTLGIGSSCQLEVSSTNIMIRTGTNLSSYGHGFVTIRYTKTTDVPGSGRWGTDGVPTHHYSTDEKVIGTWIDGKPLYEKSWEFDSYILVDPNAITSLTSKDVVLSDVDFFVNAILISKVDKRVYNTFAVGYFSGSIGVYNPLNTDAAIDKIILQYTKSTD